MAENSSENSSYRSKYGIEKLRDYTYHTWSFQCQMLLSEKRLWKVVNGEYTRPIYDERTSSPVSHENSNHSLLISVHDYCLN